MKNEIKMKKLRSRLFLFGKTLIFSGEIWLSHVRSEHFNWDLRISGEMCALPRRCVHLHGDACTSLHTSASQTRCTYLVWDAHISFETHASRMHTSRVRCTHLVWDAHISFKCTCVIPRSHVWSTDNNQITCIWWYKWHYLYISFEMYWLDFKRQKNHAITLLYRL